MLQYTMSRARRLAQGFPRAGALLLGLGLLLLAPAAQASVVVKFSLELSTGAAGAMETYNGSFRLIGEPSIKMEASADLLHPFVGYDASAIAGFTLDTILGVDFGVENIVAFGFASTPAAAVWFDALPQIGTSPKMGMYLVELTGTDAYQLFLGTGSCSPCTLGDEAMIRHNLFKEYFGRIASVSVTAVPVPAALPLLATALAGLGLLARRRRRSA